MKRPFEVGRFRREQKTHNKTSKTKQLEIKNKFCEDKKSCTRKCDYITQQLYYFHIIIIWTLTIDLTEKEGEFIRRIRVRNKILNCQLQ